MMYFHSFSNGKQSVKEHRLICIRNQEVSKNSEANNEPPMSEREKAMHKELNDTKARLARLEMMLKQKPVEVKSAPDALKAREHAMSQFALMAPLMPRMGAEGRPVMSAIERSASYQNPRARYYAQNRINNRYFVGQSAYLRARPQRYVRVPQRVEPMKAPAPYRMRFNNIDGQYWEIFNPATGQYEKGDTIKSMQEIMYFRERREVEHAAGRERALRVVKDFNENRQDPKWKRLDKDMAVARSIGMTGYELAPRSLREANGIYASRMNAFETDFERRYAPPVRPLRMPPSGPAVIENIPMPAPASEIPVDVIPPFEQTPSMTYLQKGLSAVMASRDAANKRNGDYAHNNLTAKSNLDTLMRHARMFNNNDSITGETLAARTYQTNKGFEGESIMIKYGKGNRQIVIHHPGRWEAAGIYDSETMTDLAREAGIRVKPDMVGGRANGVKIEFTLPGTFEVKSLGKSGVSETVKVEAPIKEQSAPAGAQELKPAPAEPSQPSSPGEAEKKNAQITSAADEVRKLKDDLSD
jgi:hypothetical protein